MRDFTIFNILITLARIQELDYIAILNIKSSVHYSMPNKSLLSRE